MMTALRRVPALLLMLSLATCSDDPAEPGAGRADVSGTVALVKTGAGVPDVVAVLQRDGHVIAAAPTDAAGRFLFRGMPRAPYTVRLTGLELSGLSLRHTSFEPIAQDVEVSGRAAEVVFGVVGLIPARILGDVTCNGQPVAGARLRVVGGSTDVTVESNAQGRYAATDLEPGNFAVLLEAPPAGCLWGTAWSVAEVAIGQSAEVDFHGTN